MGSVDRLRPAMRWTLVAVKVALAALLVVGAVAPSVGGFAGKGMAFRLPLFLAPALVVPVWWLLQGRRRAGSYPAALDIGLTVPFLLDTLGNAVGAYDHIDATDDVLHLVNWVFLIGGITAHLCRRGDRDRVLLWLAGTGIGAVAIIGWEIAEYGVMQLGVAGLSLTYGDTLADLALSTTGGAAGALWAVRRQRS
jgi:hypothetical protein